MAASPKIIRLVLQKLANDASTGAVTLLSVLQTAAFGTVGTTLAGKFVVESESAGVSTRYELPVSAVQGVSPREVAEMLSDLLDYYALAVAPTTQQFPRGNHGGGLPSGVGANDAAIVAWLLNGPLVVIQSFATDFSQTNIR